MKNVLLIFLVIFMSHFAMAQKNWLVESSTINFKIKNMGFWVEGKFSDLSAQIIFDNTNLAVSQISANTSATTINTGNKTRDNHLRGSDYFHTTLYPYVTLKSTRIIKEGNAFVGYFNLSIKNKTKEVKIPFTFENNMFKGNFEINRRDFGIGGNSMVLGDMVKIDLSVKVK